MLMIASLAWREEGETVSLRDEAPSRLGRFEGVPPWVEWLDDGRKVRLIKPISFTHDDWDPWPVPAGVTADGASIPRLFWSVIGGPFEGRYRNASIVHDHYCVTRDRPWRDVHRMFFEAMLAGGVSRAQAKIMYYAVYRFGPRWDLGMEAPDGDIARHARQPGELAMIQAAKDAEAIIDHDLNRAEIEALADARSGTEANLEGPEAPEVLVRARNLVIAGGQGSPDDVEAVAQQAAILPLFLIDRFERRGVRIVACRDSVTDFERALQNVVPRGWDRTGKTWDDVPGAYFPDRKRVVIATIADGAERVVPTRASRRHGSLDLVVHESFHGYDYIGGHAVLGDAAFLVARSADLDRLGPYERQEGQAGLEESFAESGARYVAQPDVMRAEWPNLFAYWQAGPGESPIMEGPPLESLQPDDAPIGTAEVLPDGTLEMELRAEGPGGAIGHASLSLPLEEMARAEARGWLPAGRTLEETAGEGAFLLMP